MSRLHAVLLCTLYYLMLDDALEQSELRRLCKAAVKSEYDRQRTKVKKKAKCSNLVHQFNNPSPKILKQTVEKPFKLRSVD